MNLDFLKSFINFSDGGNSDASTFSIRDTELALLDADDLILTKNVRVDPLGPVRGRLGTQLLNNATGYNIAAAGVINFPIKLLHRYYRMDGTHRLVLTANTRCFSVLTSDYTAGTNIPPSGGAAPDPAFANTASQTDVNVQWEALTFKDWVYMTSPLALPKRTDGTFLYRVGEDVTAVTTAPSLIAGTIPAGTYYYVLTRIYRDGLGESPVSAEFSFVLGAPGGIQHTLPALERTDQTAWNLYRSIVGQQGGPYFLVNTSPLAPGAFNDTFLEGALGSRVDTTRIEPFASSFCAIHHERLWLARITENLASPLRFYFDLQFSDANAPDQFPAEFRLRFPNPSGEPLTGIWSYQGTLFLFTMNHVFAVIGTGVERGARVGIPDYRVVLYAKGPGAMSQRVIQELNGAVYFTNKTDVWRMTGNRIDSLSEFRVRRFLARTLDTALVNRTTGAITRNQYRITYPKLGGTGLPQQTLIYDVQAGAFVPDDGYQIHSYCYMAGEADAGELLGTAAENNSLLYRMDSGNTDWGVVPQATKAVPRKFRTKDFAFGRALGDFVAHKHLVVEGTVTGATTLVTAHLDRDKASIQVGTLLFEEEGANWDDEGWDFFDWALTGLVTHDISLPQSALSERIALTVEQSDLQAPFEIERLTFGGMHKGARLIGGS
jgi:hypothetical protein